MSITTTPRLHVSLRQGDENTLNVLHWPSKLWSRITWTPALRFTSDASTLAEELDKPSFQMSAQRKSFRERIDSSGRTFLSHAAEKGKLEALFELIALGSDLDTPDRGGRTALGWAVIASQEDAFRLLLAAGADPDAGTDSARRLASSPELGRFGEILRGEEKGRRTSRIAALFLLAVCWLLPLLNIRHWRRYRSHLVAYYLVIASHQFLVLLNTFWRNVSPSDGDTIRFHLSTVVPVGDGAYQGILPAILSVVYQVFGRSFFLGSGLSIFCYSLSALVFLALTVQLGSRPIVGALSLLLVGLLPPSLLYYSLILREPYVLLLILCAISVLFRFLDSPRGEGLLSWLVLVATLAFFHRAFLLWLPVWLGLSLYLVRQRVGKNQVVIVTLGLLMFVGFSGGRYYLEGGTSQIVRMTDALREGTVSRGARTTYPTHLDVSSVGSAVLSIPAAFGAYMLYPTPLEIDTKADLYAFLENVLRVTLLLFAAVSWRWELEPSTNAKSRYLLLSYLFMEMVWSIGTQNWGTAIRHHALSFPLLVLACQSGFSKLYSLFNSHGPIDRNFLAFRAGTRSS